jgi:hypothetical protein
MQWAMATSLIEKFAANLEELSQQVQDKLNTDFESYGLKNSLSFSSRMSLCLRNSEKEIFDYSRLNKIDMQKLSQFRTHAEHRDSRGQ